MYLYKDIEILSLRTQHIIGSLQRREAILDCGSNDRMSWVRWIEPATSTTAPPTLLGVSRPQRGGGEEEEKGAVVMGRKKN